MDYTKKLREMKNEGMISHEEAHVVYQMIADRQDSKRDYKSSVERKVDRNLNPRTPKEQRVIANLHRRYSV